MSDRYGGGMDLRALRILTIALPVAFLVALELVRQVAADESMQARGLARAGRTLRRVRAGEWITQTGKGCFTDRRPPRHADSALD